VAGAGWGEIGLSDEWERDPREELATLIGLHEVALYRYLVAFTGDREVALDCLQDTFTRAYEQLQRGKSVNTNGLTLTPRGISICAHCRPFNTFEQAANGILAWDYADTPPTSSRHRPPSKPTAWWGWCSSRDSTCPQFTSSVRSAPAGVVAQLEAEEGMPASMVWP
jgi:hypothetical protein